MVTTTKIETMKLQALTMVNLATSWFEIESIPLINSASTALAFNQARLCH